MVECSWDVGRLGLFCANEGRAGRSAKAEQPVSAGQPAKPGAQTYSNPPPGCLLVSARIML